jgi:heme/copper-type cytochrome/quinol oxidase subunit 4
MKILNGIISVLLGVLSLYLMFLTPQTDQDIVLGFMVLLISIIFMCFMIMGEQTEEIEKLRSTIFRINNIRY